MIKRNMKEAVKWYTKAAEQGHPTSQLRLGCCFVEGTGCRRDPEKAADLLRASAHQLHKDQLEAIWELVVLIQTDDAVKNLEEASCWLERAADLGCKKCQTRLGKMYMDATFGCKQDLKQGLHWLGIAAAQGNVDAQNLCADAYFSGVPGGCPQDEHKAIGYLKCAARQGSATAQLRLARVYSRGDEPDLKRALKYAQKASQAGNKDAQAFIKRLVTCDVCGASTGTFCSRCSSVAYCSAKCQKEGWTKHKADCRRIVASRAAKEPASVQSSASKPKLLR